MSPTCHRHSQHRTVLTLTQAHAQLGHTDVEKTWRTAEAIGWVLKDEIMKTCTSWASGNTKQRHVPKKSDRVQATNPVEWWYHDISMISDRDGASCPKKQWHLQHDEFSRYPLSISNFHEVKDGFSEPYSYTQWQIKGSWQSISKWAIQENIQSRWIVCQGLTGCFILCGILLCAAL